MKYLVLLCDGMADRPIPSLGGKTILEAAHIPNMDGLAKKGRCGFVHTVPDGMAPGSDVCNLSVFGYDPKKYYTGRSPLEAVSMGIDLGENDTALRCNIVTLSQDGSVMKDFTAGHISGLPGNNVINGLRRIFADDGVEFYKGVGYRNLAVVRNRALSAKTVPPHDITDKKIKDYLPEGEDGEFLREIMTRAAAVFETGEDTGLGNAIWLWGQGKRPALPSYESLFGLRGAVISAVDLIKGIGMCAGLDIINVPGATGFIDTNFEGKARYALEALESRDYVFLHVEAPDESGHMGSVENKLFSAEAIDSRMIPIITEGIKKFGDYRILVMPDHPTPIELKTHSSDAVPAIICGSGVEADDNDAYGERVKPSFEIKNGYEIARYFIKS